MYEFSNAEFDTAVSCIRESGQDLCCLDAWIDSLESELSNTISPKACSAFRGFVGALQKHNRTLLEIFKSKDLLFEL